jgi:HEAT repeat protein
MYNKQIFFIILFIINVMFSGLVYSQPSIPIENIPPNIDPIIKSLIEKLYSTEPAHRGKAVFELGQMRTNAIPAIPFLIGMLGDRGTVSLQDYKKNFETLPIDKEVKNALIKIGKPAIGPLISALKDENGAVRNNAADALGEIRDSSALDPLILALKDRKSSVQGSAREAIFKIIKEMKDKGDIENLVLVLHSEEKIVRQISVKVMTDLHDERIIGPLIYALNDEDSQVQEDAAQALMNMGSPVVEPLLNVLNQENISMTCSAIIILGNLKDSRAVEPLIGVLKYFTSWKVRYEAAKSLGKIKDRRSVLPLIDALDDKHSKVREGAAEALRQIGPIAVEPLITALNDENPNICHDAIVLLGDIKDGQAVEHLIGVLKNYELWTLRFEAARALGKIKDPRAIEPLIEALNDKDAYVREGVKSVLNEITHDYYERNLKNK